MTSPGGGCWQGDDPASVPAPASVSPEQLGWPSPLAVPRGAGRGASHAAGRPQSRGRGGETRQGRRAVQKGDRPGEQRPEQGPDFAPPRVSRAPGLSEPVLHPRRSRRTGHAVKTPDGGEPQGSRELQPVRLPRRSPGFVREALSGASRMSEQVVTGGEGDPRGGESVAIRPEFNEGRQDFTRRSGAVRGRFLSAGPLRLLPQPLSRRKVPVG